MTTKHPIGLIGLGVMGRSLALNLADHGFDVSLHTDDLAQARRWFEQLSEGGKQVMPFAETFWSPGFGSLVDRFGIPWMVNTDGGPDWKPTQGA